MVSLEILLQGKVSCNRLWDPELQFVCPCLGSLRMERVTELPNELTANIDSCDSFVSSFCWNDILRIKLSFENFMLKV